jgi:hypothetical protein
MPRLAFGRAKSRTPSPAWRGIPMKDATKERQMDEELVRCLAAMKAATKQMEPLKHHMERIKLLEEAYPVLSVITAISSAVPPVPVATNQPPLRAPGLQARTNSDTAPTLQHRPPQKTDASPTNQAPRNEVPNYEDEKQRTTNLERAIRAAMESMHRSTGRYATLDELIQYLKESDETGYILSAIGDGVAWSNTKGEKSTTGRRGIQKHWKKYAMTR